MPTRSDAHGYSVEGVQGMMLSNIEAMDTWGDGV